MEKKYILDDEILYLETLTNGMKVFIQPKPKFIQTFASLYVDFGGRDFRYHRNNIEYNLPRGTAHFLEHLLFENNGDTLTKNFIEANADINAFTARKVTSYYFSTKNQFYPLLLRLFDNFVDFSFSEKTIKKEGKIIAQELSIDDDSESVKAYKSLLRLLYKDDSIYQDIGGTKATIKAIDKTVLEQAIEHFYHPKNMTLLVTGNVDPVQLIETLNSHEFVKKTWPEYYPIERFVDLTDKSVHYKRKIDKKLETNLVEIGIKIPEHLFKNRQMEHFLLLDPFLEMIFDPSTKIYKTLQKKNLYNHSLTVTPMYDGDYSFINISIETKKSKQFVKAMKELLLEIPVTDIPDKIFKAFHRAEIGRTIKSFDDVKETHNLLETLILNNVDITEYFERKKNIKLENFNDLKQVFTKNNIYLVEYVKQS